MDEHLIERINGLKRERNAVILAHNYQVPEVQDIADFVGDSLGLSQQAAATDADVIVFCGVHFMAETAAILSPHKTVLLPDINAGCPMADMITAEDLLGEKAAHAGATVVAYVNTSAAVKAETDLCCTSANAVKVVNHVPAAEEVIFIPDKFLGDYVRRQTGRDLILWRGFCPTHAKIMAEDIERARGLHPEAKVVVHPECRPEVICMADAVESTSGILRYCHEEPDAEFIIGTELGILHRLHKENPGKTFHPASEHAVCPNMKLTTLEKVLWALEDNRHVITVPEAIAARARGAIDRMIEIV